VTTDYLNQVAERSAHRRQPIIGDNQVAMRA